MRPWIALCLMTLLPGPAGADGLDPPTVGWEEIETRLRDHPQVAYAAAQVDAAEGRRLAAHGWPNPEIEGELGQAWSYDGAEQRTVWGVALGTELPFPGVIAGRVRAASGELDGARAGQRLAWRETVVQARALYLALVRDQDAAALWADAVRQSEELRHMVEVRVERGEDRPLEGFRADTELARSRMEAERAAVAWTLHRDALRRWLGADLPADFRVRGSELRAAIPAAEELRAAVRASDPRLAAGEAELQAARGALGEARGEVAPELHVGVGYGEELDARAVTGGLGLEIPLGSPGVGAVAAARAEERMAELALAGVQREVDLAADEVWAGWSSADLAVRRYEDAIVPAAGKTTDALWVAYRAGEVSLLEALDARRVHVEVQLEALEAELERALAAEQGRALMGEYDDAN
jgi:outer membrane protein TolC